MKITSDRVRQLLREATGLASLIGCEDRNSGYPMHLNPFSEPILRIHWMHGWLERDENIAEIEHAKPLEEDNDND